MIKLRRCPFCGGEAMLHQEGPDQWGVVKYTAACGHDDCATNPYTDPFHEEETAASAWNQRPIFDEDDDGEEPFDDDDAPAEVTLRLPLWSQPPERQRIELLNKNAAHLEVDLRFQLQQCEYPADRRQGMRLAGLLWCAEQRHWRRYLLENALPPPLTKTVPNNNLCPACQAFGQCRRCWGEGCENCKKSGRCPQCHGEQVLPPKEES